MVVAVVSCVASRTLNVAAVVPIARAGLMRMWEVVAETPSWALSATTTSRHAHVHHHVPHITGTPNVFIARRAPFHFPSLDIIANCDGHSCEPDISPHNALITSNRQHLCSLSADNHHDPR